MTSGTFLIVTYGRSGSTLLMGLLNRIDGYLIRGENHSSFQRRFRTVQSLQKTELELGEDRKKGARHPWFNDFEHDAIQRQRSKLARNILCGSQIPLSLSSTRTAHPPG